MGVISGTATTGGNISGTNVLTLTFGSTGQKLGIMLVDFGSVSGELERAQLVFKNGATTVFTSTITACRTGAVLASYSINTGAPFNSVALSALTRVGSSNFIIISACRPYALLVSSDEQYDDQCKWHDRLSISEKE